MRDDTEDPIKIYNQYAKYPKIEEFNKKFFEAKAQVYAGKNYSVKVKSTPALNEELKHFFNTKKVETNFELAYKILKFLKRI